MRMVYSQMQAQWPSQHESARTCLHSSHLENLPVVWKVGYTQERRHVRVAALTRHQLRILFKRFPGGAVLTGEFLDDYISAGRLEFGQVHGAMRAPEKRFCLNL